MTREESFAKVIEIIKPFVKKQEALDAVDEDTVNTVADAVELIEAKIS